jgi:type II secretory pathway pseudopilin PulG
VSWPLIAAIGVLFTPVIVLQIRRAVTTERARARAAAEQDALRLLDADLDEYLLDHPDIAAGFNRLRAAIRDEQRKGDMP